MVAVPLRDFGPDEIVFDFGEPLDVDLATDSTGLVKAVALDVDGTDRESGFLERKAWAFGDHFSCGSDESAAVVDGTAGFVAEEVGVDVDGAEGA